MTTIRSIAIAALISATTLTSLPAAAQIYFGGPRPPIVEPGYERDMRRERWRERREMERREAWGERRFERRCRIVTFRDRDEWGRRILSQERVCR